MIKALLLMAGTGTRFGSDLPKQFHKLAGKKIYLHTLERFLEVDIFEEIILVCPSQMIEEVKKDVETYCSEKIRMIPGGETRQASSYLGLLACGSQTQYVVIHDAARPLVSREIIQNNVIKAQEYKAVNTCIPSTDTLAHTTDGQNIDQIPPRSSYLRGQTPQSFSYEVILHAHLQAKEQQATDDCGLVLQAGIPVHIVLGSEENIKITTPIDLHIGEHLLRLKA